MRHLTASLTGGLGNQLFQLANVMALSSEGKVALEASVGKPRKSSDGAPEISSFDLPDGIEVLPERKTSWLLKKACGYTLRVNISPRGFEASQLFNSIIHFLTSLLISLHLRRLTYVKACRGLGYSVFKQSSRNRFIIGYAQSYRNASKATVRDKLQEIKPRIGSIEIESYRELARRENPLAVHIRLTDYEQEETFGIPDLNYYAESFKLLQEERKIGRVWIFTDDQEKAREQLPKEIISGARWIPEVAGSAACTLEVMRLAENYIIGNSTFSWWAAFLSYSKNPIVIAPQPWFRGMREPLDLIPNHWIRVPAWR